MLRRGPPDQAQPRWPEIRDRKELLLNAGTITLAETLVDPTDRLGGLGFPPCAAGRLDAFDVELVHLDRSSQPEQLEAVPSVPRRWPRESSTRSFVPGSIERPIDLFFSRRDERCSTDLHPRSAGPR
jgi:hypothetical protein